MENFKLNFTENSGFKSTANYSGVQESEVVIKDVRVNDISVVASNGIAYVPKIPTNVSELSNDSGYITNSALEGYATETWSDNKFATKTELNNYATKQWSIDSFSGKVDTGYSIDVYNINNTLTIQLKNIYGNVLSTKSAALPRTISSVRYEASTKSIVFVFTDGNEISVSIAALISEETQARIAADNVLRSSIEQEVLDRRVADTTLQENIDAEITSRELAITNESTSRISGDASLYNRIDEEIENREAQVSAEALLREQADDELNESLSEEITTRQSAITNLSNQLDTEIGNRTSGDTTLQNNINQEKLDRQSAVNAEKSSRELADGALNTLINQEVLDRQSAITTTEGKITEEKNARISADNTLQNNIDGKVDKVAGKGLSTNDYTTTEKTKLSGIQEGAEVNVQSDFAQTDSTQDDFIKNKPTKLSDFEDDKGFGTDIEGIKEKIPTDASSSNKMTSKEYVDNAIATYSAFYITKDASGNPFNTKAELDNATEFYSGGVIKTPTKNDYTIILSDETKENACTRYVYNNQWEFQYKINESPMTPAQLAAINSGITSTLVSNYSSHIEDNDIHVTTQDKSNWNNKIDGLGNAPDGGPYRLPYFFKTNADENKVTVIAETISLDGSKTTKSYSLDVLPATTTNAGLMSASDKSSLENKADKSNTYNKTEVNTLLENKADVSSVPTKTSDLTNDSNFANKNYVDNHHDSTKQNTLTAGSNISIVGNTISATGVPTNYIKNAVASGETEKAPNTTLTLTKEDGSIVIFKRGSVVTTETTGTALSTVKYITIDGVQRKIGGLVDSVNGKTGDIVLTINDLSEGADYLILDCGSSTENI